MPISATCENDEIIFIFVLSKLFENSRSKSLLASSNACKLINVDKVQAIAICSSNSVMKWNVVKIYFNDMKFWYIVIVKTA